jgi:nucleotide-binding universal stress UspA family protein
MKRILVAADGSDHALEAAELAGELAATMSAEVAFFGMPSLPGWE